ncbi:lysozyme inhibitor LprI family protein [Ruegeria profundi]|uniref:lysozyme inhibitor LprI family protein n=1 Tax=Ruegeria profundi TaxID=1685378 RepID=UPI001CD43825|nr:lysozyme inhibitor LprI family protein [Ruegeria profundi]MCA0927374.1 lysozyme inhibitor LprI family protein [Ruegeria profundi]
MRGLAFLIAALLPPSAVAQSSCNGQTQFDLNFCAKEKWEIADRELNRIWGEVKPLADTRGEGQALLEQQRAWLKSRDAICEPELSAGGSADAMFYWSCMEEQTLARNKVLETLQ